MKLMHTKDNASKTVLLVISSLLPGGAERVTLGLAEYLKNEGWDPHLFVACDIKNHAGLYIVPNGIPVYKSSFGSGNKILRPILNCIHLRHVMKKINPVWVISLGAQYKVLSLAGCFNNSKVLLSERNYPLAFYKKNMLRKVEKYYSRATKVVFQTKSELECYKEFDSTKAIIIPNSVKQDLPQWSGQSSKRVAFVGRLMDQKNPMLALKAFSIFIKSHEDWALDFYGDGPLKELLICKARSLNITDKVVFHGNVSDVVAKVATSGMYISTSNYEGISNSMLEALAMGVPSVCTDCAGGGARIAIKNGKNGFLVKCDDALAVAKCMDQIAKYPSLAKELSFEAVESAKQFEPSRIYSMWLKAIS